jgi:putative PEP-CTERM system TPR-repeat lipoprotein
MVALATLEARAENPDAAVQWLERAVAADVTAMAPRLLLARYWVGERAFEAAEPVASAAVGLDETNAEAHNLLGLAQQGTGKSAEALASFTEAARLDPEQSVYRMNKARVEMAMGEMDRAEETLLGSEGIDLDDIRASVLVAAMKAREGDAAGAMKIAKDLQAHHPDDAVPYALEAELLAVGRHFLDAAAVYEKALSLRPEDRRLALRAFRVRNTGRLENPEAPLLDYLERRPLDTELRLVVAQAWQSRGESARAIAEYERVLATAPDDFVALNNLAWAYFEGGDPRAEELARRAFEQSPENGSVADTLGWIQVKKGNVDEGIPNLRKAVEFSDGNPEVKYHLAAGLAAAGEADEARRILEETLSAADDFGGRQEAKRLLESL